MLIVWRKPYTPSSERRNRRRLKTARTVTNSLAENGYRLTRRLWFPATGSGMSLQALSRTLHRAILGMMPGCPFPPIKGCGRAVAKAPRTAAANPPNVLRHHCPCGRLVLHWLACVRESIKLAMRSHLLVREASRR